MVGGGDGGSVVGLVVGDGVGALVLGLFVGDNVGALVLGLLVGAAVVGERVGLSVGALVGGGVGEHSPPNSSDFISNPVTKPLLMALLRTVVTPSYDTLNFPLP